MDDASWPNPATILDDLPDDLRARIKGELAPGERLLWASRAVPRAWEKGMNYPAMLLFAGGFAALSATCMGAFFGPFAARLRGVEGLLFLVGLAAGFVAFCILATIVATIGSLVLEIPQASAGRGQGVCPHRSPRHRLGTVGRLRGDRGRVVSASQVGPGPPRRVSRRLGRRRGRRPEGAQGEESWDTLKFEGIPDVRRVEALVRATLIGHDPVTLVP